MKNILIVGSSSTTAKHLVNYYKNDFNFIKLSRDETESDVENFNVLDTNTYFKSEMKFDGLVYFPGTINLKQFHRLSINDFQNDLNINVIGLVNILKFYYNQINEGGSVVLFSTVASKLGMPFHASVSTSKSAILGLMKSLAAEWAPRIRVNCVSPSIFESKMSERMLRNEKAAEKISNNHPLKRFGKPEDISNLIHFLISDKSSWITGQNISVDGGMSTLKL